MIFKLLILATITFTSAFAGGFPYKEAGVVRRSALASEARDQLKIAQEVIRAALRSDRSNRQLRAMSRKASRAEIWDASAHEICRAGAAMRAEEGGRRIYVCSNFDLDWYTPEMKVQMMLHEITHLTGVTGSEECRADAIARNTMGAVGIESAPSGYDAICELEGLY